MVGPGGAEGGGSGDVACSIVPRLVRRGISLGVVVSTAAFFTDAEPFPRVFLALGVTSSSAASCRFSLDDLRGVGAGEGVASRSERMS